MSIIRKIRRRFVRAFLNIASFEFWQRNGFHVLPVHYYSPIPDTENLDKQVFKRISELKGIDTREENQIDLLKSFSSLYRKEYDAFPDKPSNEKYRFHTGQTSFRCVDAQMLYCFVRHFKPKRVVEIGSGYSTMITAQALEVNAAGSEAVVSDFKAIEPYPNEIIKKGFPGLTSLISTPVQEVSMNVFTSLQENDILFIDSTHTVKTGSDVNHEFLEILPRLNKGVLIHVHDIFLPYEYPSGWILNGRFWAEQYLVQAFLAFNDSFEVVWMSHLMHRRHSDLLKASMKFYDPDVEFVGSLWLRKIK
jgi:hypothetical protein